MFEGETCGGFCEIFRVFDDELAAAQSAPGLRLVAAFPVVGFGRIEDQSRDWILMRVGTDVELVVAHIYGDEGKGTRCVLVSDESSVMLICRCRQNLASRRSTCNYISGGSGSE